MLTESVIPCTLIPFDGTAPTLVSSGSITNAASLTFNTSVDPTMLPNGDYTLELKATDVDDNLTTVLDRHVSLQGRLKLGREQLSVTDLTIPVAQVRHRVLIAIDRIGGAVAFQAPVLDRVSTAT